MKYFKLFEADETVQKPVTETTTKEPEKKTDDGELPSTTISVTFVNTFEYNLVKPNESFQKSMNDARNQLDEFMKNENKDGKVDVVQINASGYASWVPTKYKSNDYEVKNNNVLAKDRAESIAGEVKKEIEKYFKDKNIPNIQYKKSELKGTTDYETSKKVFREFLEKYFKANPKNLVTELLKTNLNNVTLIKEPKADNKLYDGFITTTEYGAKHPNDVVKLTVEEKNAQQIYDLMMKSPIFVRGTYDLKSGDNKIKDWYRQRTQYAKVDIIINDPEKTKPKEEPKQDPIKNELESITFDKDVDTIDANGEKAMKKLIDFLNSFDMNRVQHLILIGHAEADDELDKVVFDPNNKEPLKNPKTGKVTNMSEAELADLRFVLSIARLKKVYQGIKDLKGTKQLYAGKKFWIFPAGTYFGEKLKDHQRIVQIVVLTTDGQELNTEINAVPFGKSFESSPVLSSLNAYIKQLGYNINKLIVKYLGPSSIEVPVPNHIEMAKDPNKLANFRRDLT